MASKKKANEIIDDIDRREFYDLMRRSVRATEINAQTNEMMRKYVEALNTNMQQLNDNFVLHCRLADDIKAELDFVKKDLIHWLKMTLIIIFVLLGGIIFTRALGFDVVDLITKF